MTDQIQTKEINFSSTVELPAIKSTQYQSQIDKTATQKLKGASNKIKGKGRAKPQLSLGDEPENVTVNLDAILEDNLVETLTPEYFNTLLGKRKIEPAVKERALKFINDTIEGNNPAIAEHFRNTCINIIDSMYGTGSRISLEEYIKASLFVTYRMSGDTKVKAYTKVFPERVQRMQRDGQSMAHLNMYAHTYSLGQAVVDIQAKMLIPAHIMCHDLFYEAMRVTADIMVDDKVSPKVRVDAAKNIMEFTRQPEIKKQELEISVKQSDEIEQLKSALFELSAKQQESIIEGNYKVLDVTSQTIYTEESNNE